MLGYGRIWEDMGGYGRIWEDMGGVTLAIISGIGWGDMGGAIDHTVLHAAQDWVWGTLGRKWQLGCAREKVSQYPEHTMIN